MIVLARDDAGSSRIFAEGGVPKLQKLLESKDFELRLTAIRVLASLCRNSKDRVREHYYTKGPKMYVPHC